MTMDKDHHQSERMDAEDIGIEIDKMDAAQRDKKLEIDQEKVQQSVEKLVEKAKQGQKQEAIDGLLAIEKQGRLAEDVASTRLACRTIIEVCGICIFFMLLFWFIVAGYISCLFDFVNFDQDNPFDLLLFYFYYEIKKSIYDYLYTCRFCTMLKTGKVYRKR